VTQKFSRSPTNSDINSDGFENTKHISISPSSRRESDADSYADYEETMRPEDLEQFLIPNPSTTRPSSHSTFSEPSNFRRLRELFPRTSSEDSVSQRVIDAEARADVFTAWLKMKQPRAEWKDSPNQQDDRDESTPPIRTVSSKDIFPDVFGSAPPSQAFTNLTSPDINDSSFLNNHSFGCSPPAMFQNEPIMANNDWYSLFPEEESKTIKPNYGAAISLPPQNDATSNTAQKLHVYHGESRAHYGTAHPVNVLKRKFDYTISSDDTKDNASRHKARFMALR
jgi:hypothetical protein